MPMRHSLIHNVWGHNDINAAIHRDWKGGSAQDSYSAAGCVERPAGVDVLTKMLDAAQICAD